MSGIFFPQRIALRIDGGSVSPAVLEKKVLAVAYAPSYSIGELLLRKIGGIELSGRGLNKTAVKIGLEMVAHRDARIEAYFDQPLPRQHAQPKTPITLACVSVDGGRMQTRDEGGGKGVHHPHWRENKNALFLRMKSGCFADDPQPDLPACFANRERMKKLLSGIGEGNTPPTAAEEAASAADIAEKHVENDWRPKRLFRTCLSSLEDSNAFGRMMETEADARLLSCRQESLRGRWTAVQLDDSERSLLRLYADSRFRACGRTSLRSSAFCARRRGAALDGLSPLGSTCWGGNILPVISELREHQRQVGLPPKDCEKTDPRKVLADAVGYFQNNVSRMNYPAYRRQGLPTTSAHMESLVKEINAQVKGTEKFWNDGASGEAILQIRAAALCDDDRLTSFMNSRPGHPFHANAPRTPAINSAG